MKIRCSSPVVRLFVLATCCHAQEYSPVPGALEQIADPVFRDALGQYSPSCNAVPRDAQITSYVNTGLSP